MKLRHQVKIWTNEGNTYLERSKRVFALAILTFAIPLLQWLAGQLIETSGYSTVIGNLLIIFAFGFWSVRNNLFSYYPPSTIGRVILYFMGFSVLALLILNLQSQSVSGITGKVRSSYEVVDIIVLGSIAEELVFRGVMWSLFAQLFKRGGGYIAALVGTSILFGVEHLGYWAQSSWPLPFEAYLHSASMIFAGIFFGIFRLKTRSLTIPVMIHMLANGMILLSQ